MNSSWMCINILLQSVTSKVWFYSLRYLLVWKIFCCWSEWSSYISWVMLIYISLTSHLIFLFIAFWNQLFPHRFSTKKMQSILWNIPNLRLSIIHTFHSIQIFWPLTNRKKIAFVFDSIFIFHKTNIRSWFCHANSKKFADFVLIS